MAKLREWDPPFDTKSLKQIDGAPECDAQVATFATREFELRSYSPHQLSLASHDELKMMRSSTDQAARTGPRRAVRPLLTPLFSFQCGPHGPRLRAFVWQSYN